eukprot:m.58480 g.58480  ORF g.58480 m.58480 type:complete len:512 (+) comp22557_c0_seq1:169-1704(+)
MPPKPKAKDKKAQLKENKKEVEKWIKDNDLGFVTKKLLAALGCEWSMDDLTILLEEDVRSAGILKPVELRKFMNATQSYAGMKPDNTPTSPTGTLTKPPAKPPASTPTKPKEGGGSQKGKSTGKGMAKAKFKWTAESDEQLNIDEDEILTVIDDARKWWKVRNAAGDEGTVPSNYVLKITDAEAKAAALPSASPQQSRKTSVRNPALPAEMEEAIYAPVNLGGDDGDEEHDYEDPDEVAENAKDAKQHWKRTETVKVVPNTEPLGSDPLEWMNGEVIRWLTENDLSDFKDVFYANGFDGATLVTLSAQSFKLGGFDPARCDKLQDCLDSLSDPIIGKAKALYGYQATKPTQLSFKEGDILQVIDNSSSWWKSKSSDGQKGMVPSNYLEMLPKETKPGRSSASSTSEDSIEDAPWFCNKDRKQAEALLNKPSKQHGDFLIRPSRTNPGDHTLTAVGPSGIMNLKIQEQNPGVFVLGQFSSQFNSIAKLVEHHKGQEIRITGKEPVLLRRPVR